ncbi:MAG: hypothetical protein EBT22_08575 [Chloroflexi bacterium]|nr:hypothetical protein [Chloroflexota bacterium]
MHASRTAGHRSVRTHTITASSDAASESSPANAASLLETRTDLDSFGATATPAAPSRWEVGDAVAAE